MIAKETRGKWGSILSMTLRYVSKRINIPEIPMLGTIVEELWGSVMLGRPGQNHKNLGSMHFFCICPSWYTGKMVAIGEWLDMASWCHEVPDGTHIISDVHHWNHVLIAVESLLGKPNPFRISSNMNPILGILPPIFFLLICMFFLG